MKRAIPLLALIFLAAIASAAMTQTPTVPFCDQAPERSDCQCRTILETDRDGTPLRWDEEPDIQVTSDWMNLYCSRNGKLLQKRVALEIIKPDCKERTEITQYQEVDNTICKKCPEPKLIGGWQPIQCAGTKTVYQREVIAYYFLPNVTECELGRFMELKTEETGTCSMPGGSILLGASNNWFIILPIAVIAIAAIAFIMIKRKRR